MSSTQFTVPTAFTVMDKFTGPVRGMQNAMSAFASKAEVGLARAERGFRRLISPLTAVNKLMMGLGIYVGLFSLVRLFTGAVDIVADFQQANADLAVVMGVTTKSNKALSLEARRVGLAYGEAATEVVKMQHALATLGFEQPEIMKMGAPLITGVAALEGSTTEKLAETVGAVVNTFNNLGAGDTQHILDVMALSANRTALNFEKLATTLPIVSGPANALNISFEETVALLGVLSNAGVHVATSATSLKNIFIDSAKKGHTYQEVLANIAKQSDKLTYANKKFGKRSVVSALVLEQKMFEAKNGVHALTEEFKNVEVGLTEMIAKQRLDTFTGGIKLAKAAYQEFILGIEDGTGKYAATAQRLASIITAVLLLSTNSDAAREAISKMDAGVVQTAANWIVWIERIWDFAKALLFVKAVMIATRAVTVIMTGIQWAWNAAMGVSAFITRSNAIALKGNAVALTTLRTLTLLTTASQWGLNFAMYASPLIIFAVGIAAVVGVMSLMSGWLDDLTSGFNTFNGAITDSGNTLKTFYADEQSNRLYNPDYYAKASIPEQRKIDLEKYYNSLKMTDPGKYQRLTDQYGTNLPDPNLPTMASPNKEISKRESFRGTLSENEEKRTITVDWKHVNLPAGVEVSDESGKDLTPKTGSTMGWDKN